MSKSQSTVEIDARPWNIGVFDSGVGGLSILKELIRVFPNAHFHYIADRANVPYGRLTSEQVLDRSWWCTKTLIEERHCQMVVVACNTATAVAIDQLRQRVAADDVTKAVPIVGVEPYLNVLQKEKDRIGRDTRVAVLTTPLLAATERFQKLKEWRDQDQRIEVFPSGQLASIVEEWFDHARQGADSLEVQQHLHLRIEQELAPLVQRRPQLVILGCTHYPLIAQSLTRVLQAECVDPSRAVAARARHILQHAKCADSCPAPTAAPGQFAYMETHKKTEVQVWQSMSLAFLSQWPK